MKIFVGMETSGAFRRRFAELGHTVLSCDNLPSEDGVFCEKSAHAVADVFEALERLFKSNWVPDLAIFHIDCTYLTGSAEWAFKDPDYDRYPGVGYHQRVKPGTLVGAARREAREKAKAEFNTILKLPIKTKVVENPVGALSSIRKPSQIIQPYQFGDDASKKTCFWFFDDKGEPIPEMVLPIDRDSYCLPRLVCQDCKATDAYGAHKCPHCGSHELLPRWANQTDRGQNRLSPGDDRWKDRSRTFPGVADTAAKHWAAIADNRKDSK